MKTISTLTIILFVFNLHNIFAQAPSLQWDADFGGSDFEQFAALQQQKTAVGDDKTGVYRMSVYNLPGKERRSEEAG